MSLHTCSLLVAAGRSATRFRSCVCGLDGPNEGAQEFAIYLRCNRVDIDASRGDAHLLPDKLALARCRFAQTLLLRVCCDIRHLREPLPHTRPTEARFGEFLARLPLG